MIKKMSIWRVKNVHLKCILLFEIVGLICYGDYPDTSKLLIISAL